MPLVFITYVYRFFIYRLTFQLHTKHFQKLKGIRLCHSHPLCKLSQVTSFSDHSSVVYKYLKPTFSMTVLVHWGSSLCLWLFSLCLPPKGCFIHLCNVSYTRDVSCILSHDFCPGFYSCTQSHLKSLQTPSRACSHSNTLSPSETCSSFSIVCFVE